MRIINFCVQMLMVSSTAFIELHWKGADDH